MNSQRSLRRVGATGAGTDHVAGPAGICLGRTGRAILALGLGVTLAACSGEGDLRLLNTPRNGPDEFKILPAKPLSEPDSYTFLPVPTPGGTNRTDQNPNADAVAALGGSPAALAAADGVPSRDGAIVTYSSRYGVTADIRSVLAQSDADFRKGRGRFTGFRIVPTDTYKDIYERYALDPYAEAERFRKAGFPTPSSPPRSGE